MKARPIRGDTSIGAIAGIKLDDPQAVRSLFQRTPWLRDLSFGGEPAAKLLERQLTFGLGGSGDWGTRGVVARSNAARALLEGPHAERTQRTLSRMLGTMDGRAGQAELSGLTLATSDAGFSLSTLTDAIAWRDPSVRPLFERALKDPSERARFRSLVAQWERERRGYSAEYNGGIVTGPAATKLLTGLFRNAREPITRESRNALEAIAHELEHAISATSASVYYARGGVSALGRLEEGIAQYMTRNGSADRLAKALGVPHIGTDEYTGAYHDLVRGVEDLVWQVAPGWSRRGIPQSFDELDQLLQAVPVKEQPLRWARRIGEREQLAERDVQFVARRFATSGADRDKLAELVAEIDTRAHNASALRS